MKHIINQIKAAFTSTKSAKLDCNYTDNYYGDQYCQPKMAK